VAGDLAGEIFPRTRTRTETMTNIELAGNLEALAAKLRTVPDGDIPELHFGAYVWEKASLVAVLQAIGGKWKKQIRGGLDNIRVESVDFAPLAITIPRDKVCKKTVTWDCEPLLSPAEEAEVFAVAGVEA
jgi:hypothetical protein